MGFFDKLFNAAKAAVENTAAESTTEKAAEKPAVQPTQPEVTTPQTEKIRFGSKNPVPIRTEINGAEVNLFVVYYGTVEVNIKDPAIVQNYGGIEKDRALIEKETCILTDNNMQFRFGGRDYRMVSRLSESSQSIANMIIEQSRDIWPREYGVELIGIVYGNFALTEESRETYDKLRKAQSEQAIPQQPAQPQTPAATSAWQCHNCGAQNTSKFCTNCGAKQGQ